MSPSHESSNVRAYIVGLGVPERVSRLFSELVKDLAGIIGDAGREVYECPEAGGEDSSEEEGRRTGGASTWPMEPMVPILLCRERPKRPVTGLLPSCETAIEVGRRLILDEPSGWLTLPVNSSGWFESLQQKLSRDGQGRKTRAAIHAGALVLPLCSGLPLMCMDECGEEGFLRALDISVTEVGGWRALPLSCWEIEYLARRPWHHSIYWTPIWKRRLRRVMARSNRDGDIA